MQALGFADEPDYDYLKSLVANLYGGLDEFVSDFKKSLYTRLAK